MVVALYAAGIALLNIVLLWLAPSHVPALRLAYASGLLWVCTIPWLQFILSDERRIPFLQIIAAFYFLYFGMPVFADSVMVREQIYDQPEVTTAVELTLLGVSLTLAAFYTPLGRIVEGLPRLKLYLDLKGLSTFLLLFAALSMVATAWVMRGNVPVALRAIAAVLSRMPLLLLCGLFILQLRGQLTSFQRAVGTVIYLVYIVLALGTGALAQVMFATAPLFFIYVAERKRIPWIAGILALLLVLPFAHTKHEYRRALRSSDMGPIERVTTFFEITASRIEEGGGDFAKQAAETSNARTSYLGTFAYVVHETPRRVPYTDGETYKMMLWSFVPRVIAPGKPIQDLGQDFGHRYGLLHSQDYQTSFNCAQIVEMYMNFGYWGVLCGMFAIGLFYRALHTMFNQADGGDAMMMVSAVTFSGLLNIESDASMVLVGAPITALICYVLLLGVAFVGRRLFPNLQRA